MDEPSSNKPQITRYWLSGEYVVVEWNDAGFLDLAMYTVDHTEIDIELVVGEPVHIDLEPTVWDILTRYESPALAALKAGSLDEAPTIAEAA